MVKIKFLGGAKAVGKSAFLLSGDSAKALLDYGVLLHGEIGFPMHVRPRDLDLVILSHAHLDHSGAIPLLFLSGDMKLVANRLTIDLSKLLLKDFLRISGPLLPFEYLEIEKMCRNSFYVERGETAVISGVEVTFKNAGHVPGSVIVDLSLDGKRILYTGDMNMEETRLLSGAEVATEDYSALIIESTYFDRNHPPRKAEERGIVEFAREIVEGNGTLLIPAFSLGKAQEMLMVLMENAFPYDVYMDGMALTVNQILLDHASEVKDVDRFIGSLSMARFVSGWRERKRIVKEPCAIISSAGMLAGGAAAFYSSEVAKSEKNGIALVSYQVKGTPGRILQEKQVALVDGKMTKVRTKVRTFELSSHSGRDDLLKMIKHLKGSPRIFTVHGDEKNCEDFAREIRESFGFEAFSPSAGEEYEI